MAGHPGLHNTPGAWRWEQRGDKWWRIHDVLNIEDGPHAVEQGGSSLAPSDSAPVGSQNANPTDHVWPERTP